MAFGNIGLQEPSTITKRVASVTIDRGSTTEHQEVLVLGDVSSSNAIARVLGATPASTEFGLAVRVVEQPSTTVQVSSLAGAVIVRSSAANALFTAYQSSAADLNVTVAGYSTTANVSSVAGKVQVVNSSAGDLNVTVAGYVAPSTTIQVSSVGGIVAVRPSDTNWASSAGFHFDSSGALNIAGTFSASTTVQVSSVGGVVTVSPFASSNSSVYFPVRLTNGTAFLGAATDFDEGSTMPSTVAGPSYLIRSGASSRSSTDRWVVPWASTQGAQFMIPVTDSGVSVMDSTNRAINVNVVAGAAGGSTIVTVSTGSVGLAGVYDSSGALRKVGDSVNDAIRVNVVAGAAGGSTIVTVSTGSIRVHQSTAADLNVTVAGYSTTANISSVAGIVAVRPSDTNWASSAGFHFTSSGELTIAGTFAASTTVQVSSVGGVVSVTPNSTGWATAAGFRVNSSNDLAVVMTNYSTVLAVSTGSVRVHQSTASDLRAMISPSDTNWASSAGFHFTSSGELTVSGTFSASTTVNVSSLAGAVTVRSSAADALVTVYQSSAADLNVTVAGYSTTVNVSSIAGVVDVHFVPGHVSTQAPSSNSSGLIVRQVVDAIQTFASTSALASTTVAVTSTVANVRAYITAYSITSTNQTPAHWGFYSSNATLLWPLTLAALSSGVAGANLAVAPPGYLFRTSVSEALNFKTAGSTVAGVQLGVSYYLAP